LNRLPLKWSLNLGIKSIKLKALVDTGTSRSVISKEVADKLEAFIPLDEPYELRTADKDGRLKILGQALVKVIFTPEGPKPRKVPIEFEII